MRTKGDFKFPFHEIWLGASDKCYYSSQFGIQGNAAYLVQTFL